jgi:hypothetical protein
METMRPTLVYQFMTIQPFDLTWRRDVDHGLAFAKFQIGLCLIKFNSVVRIAPIFQRFCDYNK